MTGNAREIIEGLREEIRRIERRPPQRACFVSSGRPEVDALLPGGGFPRGALSELEGGPASGKTGLVLSALAAAMGAGGFAAFVDGRGELYPPAVAAFGVDLGHLLVVRPAPGLIAEPTWPDPCCGARCLPASGRLVPALLDVASSHASAARSSRARLGDGIERLATGSDQVSSAVRKGEVEGLRHLFWAAEALLASGAFEAVAMDVPIEGARARALGMGSLEGMLRRLRAAAEKGGAVALWLGVPEGLRVPSSVRLELSAGVAGVQVRRAFARGAEDAPRTGWRGTRHRPAPGACHAA